MGFTVKDDYKDVDEGNIILCEGDGQLEIDIIHCIDRSKIKH